MDKKIEAEDYYKNKTLDEVKKMITEEGQVGGHQFKEWWDIFQLEMICRKNNLSELEKWCVLSNRFEIKRK